MCVRGDPQPSKVTWRCLCTLVGKLSKRVREGHDQKKVKTTQSLCWVDPDGRHLGVREAERVEVIGCTEWQMASGDWNVVLGSALNFVCSLGSHCTYNRKHLCITEATVDGKSGCVLRALEADTRSALPAPPPPPKLLWG